MRVTISLIWRLLVAISLFVGSIVPALAQDSGETNTESTTSGPQIVLRPKDQPDGSRFEVEIEPGKTADLTAVLQNLGVEPIELRSYSANVIPVINGGLEIGERGETKQGASLWMNYVETEFTLAPEESKDYGFTISVPENTPSGQYVSAVALETVQPVNDDGGMFNQFFRKVVSVYITVPGEINASFKIGDPELYLLPEQSVIQLPINNTGNIRIDIQGTIRLSDSEGNVVAEGEINLSPIYPGQETYAQLAFGTVLPVGEYMLSYDLADTDSNFSLSKKDATATVQQQGEAANTAPISFENVKIEPNSDPIVFANVSVDVTTSQSNYQSTRLTLSVFLDDELVEDFVLADNLALNQGTTTVTQRYLPGAGFITGTYTFSLKLESTDGGQTSTLLEVPDVATLEVP